MESLISIPKDVEEPIRANNPGPLLQDISPYTPSELAFYIDQLKTINFEQINQVFKAKHNPSSIKTFVSIRKQLKRKNQRLLILLHPNRQYQKSV